MMLPYAKWLAGVYGGALSLAGLFMAAKGTNDFIYGAGLVVFVVGVGTVFALIHNAYDGKH